MLKITQIDNLFQSSKRITSHIIPKEILHPQIETNLVTDQIDKAYIIGVFSNEINNFVFYSCITTKKGLMYKIDHIDVSEAYLSGYNKGNQGFVITVDPYRLGTTEHLEWIKGYHEGNKNRLEPNTPI